MNHRRIKSLRVHANILLDLIKNGVHRIVEVSHNPLPEDAAIIDARYDSFRGEFVLLLHSETWPIVFEGDPPPEADPVHFRQWMPEAWVAAHARDSAVM